MPNYYSRYRKYKQKYLQLRNNYDIYFEIRGKYNGCSIVLFSENAIWNWQPNFLKKISNITQTFAYESPEVALGSILNEHQKRSKFPLKKDLNFANHAEKIYKILKDNNVKPPYVLIGHSLSAFKALVFAKKFPNETATIILLDGTRHCEHMYENSKKRMEGSYILDASDDDLQEITQKLIKKYDHTFSPDKQIVLDLSSSNTAVLKKVIKWNNNMPEMTIVKEIGKEHKYTGKLIDMILAINNIIFILKIQQWNQVPDKLKVPIVGIWNIPIIEHDHPEAPIEKKCKAQTEIIEDMKTYHEILNKENGNNYTAYFFFGQSHFLHHSNTEDIIQIIKRHIKFRKNILVCSNRKYLK